MKCDLYDWGIVVYELSRMIVLGREVMCVFLHKLYVYEYKQHAKWEECGSKRPMASCN